MNQTQVPYVGQMLDYYPDPQTRLAALCVQVYPYDLSNRPQVNLQVFRPSGEIHFKLNVHPVDSAKLDPDNPEHIRISGMWGFPHEFAILQDAEEDETNRLGTHSNDFLGQLNNAATIY